MELLLWRWSTTVQISSALMIAVFFLVLARSVRRAELRPWVNAWCVNLIALAVTVTWWVVQPTAPLAMKAARFFYLFGKTAFVSLLLIGAFHFVSPRRLTGFTWPLFGGIAVAAAVGAIVLDSVIKIGIAQASLMAIAFGVAAIILVRKPVPAVGWLCVGFTARALLASLEAIGYVNELIPQKPLASVATSIFLAAHSSFDTGAEWLIALGCVLVVYSRIHAELTRANADLTEAQGVLQQLADHDPLTTLKNRRALHDILRDASSTGATILFFDLDHFKEINDGYGHQVGDECLRVFARALRDSFRPDDEVIRYAGDEFIVVARGSDAAAVIDRTEFVRQQLRLAPPSVPRLGFSFGHAVLEPNGNPDDAVHAADAAMYEHKASRRSRRARAV